MTVKLAPGGSGSPGFKSPPWHNVYKYDTSRRLIMKLKEFRSGKPFGIVPVKRIQINKALKAMEVILDPEVEVITDKDGRKRLERSADVEWLYHQLKTSKEVVDIASDRSPLRYSAGGLLWKVNEWYVLLKRDEGAPSYPGYVTLSSGLSSTKEEIVNPLNVMIREGIEEVILANENNLILAPNIGNMEYTKIREIFNLGEKILIPSEIDSIGSPWKIRTMLENEIHHIEANLNIDPNTAGIDILGVLKLSIKEPVKFYDGEIFGNDPLNREIILLHEKDVDKAIRGEPVKVRRFKEGYELESREEILKMTPVLKTMLEGNYYI